MRRGFGVVWLAVTALIAGIASYFSYEAGVSQGLATKLPAGAAGTLPYWYGPHWGFGFFPFLGFIWFFLIVLLFVGIARGFGRWGRHHGGGRSQYFEERMRDWHRQAHEHGAEEPPRQS